MLQDFNKRRKLKTAPFTPPEIILLPDFTVEEWHQYHGNVAVPLPKLLMQGKIKQRNYNQRVKQINNPQRKLCGAPLKTPGLDYCARPAGQGTGHVGSGPCRYHDKNISLQGRNRSITVLQKYVEEMRMAGVYGNPVDIDPHTALLMEVQRTAGHVEWLREMINTVAAQDPDNAGKALTTWTPMGITPSVWIQMYQEERKHLVKVCQAAIAAGVAERTVRLAQDQARMIAMIFKSFILDNRLEFTPRQRLKAPEVIRELLSSMPANGIVLDADSTEETQAAPIASEPVQATKRRGRKQ